MTAHGIRRRNDTASPRRLRRTGAVHQAGCRAVLDFLERNGPATLADLGRMLDIRPRALEDMIDALATAGAVTVTPRRWGCLWAELAEEVKP